jgi:dTDP-4-dehydrorhamnose reductase
MEKRPMEATVNIQSALVIGAAATSARRPPMRFALPAVEVLGTGRERDATDPREAAALFAETDPDLVVLAAGFHLPERLAR